MKFGGQEDCNTDYETVPAAVSFFVELRSRDRYMIW